MTLLSRAACVLGLVILGARALAGAVPALEAVRVARLLNQPVFLTAAPGDFNKVFIVEKGSGGVARIKTAAINPFAVNPTVFLTVSGITTNGEQGLWCIAPHPGYVNNGYFWIHFSDSAGNSRIVRYRADGPDYRNAITADPASAVLVWSDAHPFTNHYGGWMAFGPDGYLYVAKGDGGSGNDPMDLARNPSTPFGKILRLDVDGPDNIPGNEDDDAFPGDPDRHYAIPPDNPFAAGGGLPEVWHYGLRNPWRCAFDRATGALYIADVGQAQREEVNYQPANAPGSLPGQPGYQGAMHWGWRCTEGTFCTALCGACPASAEGQPPIHEYGHAAGCSISGGYVYRGCNIPELSGHYFFSDFCTSRLWTFEYSGTGPVPPGNVVDRTSDLDPGGTVGIGSVVSFGEDAYGELYIIDLGGEIFRVKPQDAPFTAPDCNGNGRSDCADILDGTSQDADHDGVPDECSTGRCCFADATCQDLPVAACAAAGGDFQGVGTTCASGVCPAAIQGCCYDSGDCLVLAAADCLAAGGTPLGVGSSCAEVNCPDTCVGDYDHDGCVGLSDVAVLLSDWTNPYGLVELAEVITNWARRCGPGVCP